MQRFSRIAVFSRSFKGLPDGWKPILPITIVTGENSSGKTSLLDLLSIIDSQEFNLANSINGVVERLNQAKDIITKFGGAETVSVGYLAQEKPRTADALDSFFGKLITYEAKDDKLVIRAITVIEGRSAIRVKRRNRAIFAKRFMAPNGESGLERACELAADAHFDEQPGYKKVLEFSSPEPSAMNEWFHAILISSQLFADNVGKNKRRATPLRHLESPPLSVIRYNPVRSMPDRIHHGVHKSDFDPAGTHYPFLIKRFLEDDTETLEAIRKFGLESGLFDDIALVRLSGERGITAFSVMYEKFGKRFYADELGYGLGQILPIVTDLLSSFGDCTFLIQQPELHLHPRAQAALGSLLHSVNKAGHFVVVETHSDFLIDRLRLTQAKSVDKVEAQILFFEKPENAPRPVFTQIAINPAGHLDGAPDSYRQFFVNESIDVYENL